MITKSIGSKKISPRSNKYQFGAKEGIRTLIPIQRQKKVRIIKLVKIKFNFIKFLDKPSPFADLNLMG